MTLSVSNIMDNTADQVLTSLSEQSAHDKSPLLERLSVLTAIQSLSADAKHAEINSRQVLIIPQNRWETALLLKSGAWTLQKSATGAYSLKKGDLSNVLIVENQSALEQNLTDFAHTGIIIIEKE